jgi:predicted ArsR family transcriptional regulator
MIRGGGPARQLGVEVPAVAAQEEDMQTVRNHIVEILKENGTATVAELAEKLGMAQVSVRHHLDILVGEDLVESSGVRRRNGAGRPSQVYSLTPQAAKLFPQRHQVLANEMLAAMKSLLPAEEVQGIFLRLAEKTVLDAPAAHVDQQVEDRLDQVTEFLNQKGYTARWEVTDGRYRLFTCNCPYAGVSENNPELCEMDRTMLQHLMPEGVRRETRIADGAPRCAYVLLLAPTPTNGNGNGNRG